MSTIATQNKKPHMNSDGSFLQNNWQKLAAAAFWIAIVGGYWLYARSNDLTIGDSVRLLADILTNSLYGPVIYIALYILRPLLFFPATLITVVAGFLFGPVLGVIYVVLGSNSSALLAYFVGRFFGDDIIDSDEEVGLIQRYARRMRDNSFETILLMRLLFLPYDLVHYVAGFLRIDWKAFILATAIGSIPGTISFVLLGTSFGTLDNLINGQFEVSPISIIASVALIIASLALSRYLKAREAATLQDA